MGSTVSTVTVPRSERERERERNQKKKRGGCSTGFLFSISKRDGSLCWRSFAEVLPVQQLFVYQEHNSSNSSSNMKKLYF